MNEVGFELYRAQTLGERPSLTDLIARVRAKYRTSSSIADPGPYISQTEISDARELAQRLAQGIPPYVVAPAISNVVITDDGLKVERQGPVFEPHFSGVGILDECRGDLRFGNNLVEVKSGERSIRSTDIRQVLIYYFLSTISSGEQLHACLLLNPRQGYRLYFEFADLVSSISGMSPTEFSATIRDYLVDWKACD